MSRVAQSRPFRLPRRLFRLLHKQLRAERLGLREMAAHANRALRTLSARRTAATIHEMVTAMLRRSKRRDLDHLMHDVLRARSGWSRIGEREFLFTFGTRSATMTVPRDCDTEQLTALIARIEVKVLHGDSDPDVLMNYQTLAARELQQLASRDRR